jgi:hypothetical protein
MFIPVVSFHDTSTLFRSVPMENPEYFRCEFADPIDSHSNRDLGNNRLVALHLPVCVSRCPSRRCNAPDECAYVGKELRSQ